MSSNRLHNNAEDGAERLLRDLENRAIEAGADPVDIAMLRDRAALGAAILSLRTARGLSQIELGQLSGVEQADISRIERAYTDPRTSTLLRLLAGLDARLTFELDSESDLHKRSPTGRAATERVLVSAQDAAPGRTLEIS